MKKIKYFVPILLILCVCGMLIASLQMSGTVFGGFQTVGGFGNQGVPPSGGSCANVSQVYADDPFQGWPVQYQDCNWGVISAYYCTPHYFPGFTHYGIDLTNYWDNSGGNSTAIHGSPVIATANALVAQAVYSAPAQWNFGMGNFVQLIGLKQTCEEDINLDLNNDSVIGGYCASVCEEDINLDLNHDGTIGRYCGEESAWKATFMHLLDVTVTSGQTVQAGEVIGHVNNTGNSTGDHLHYQINGPEGAVDPASTFGCPGYDWQTGVNNGQ
jgi:murein DD-endopeptidase MepM/ murein hydrolase activator NlpD